VLAQDMGPLPKPGPEHELLAKWAGHWTSTTTMSMGPQKVTWSGTVDTRIVAGGLWLVSEHKGNDPKMPFEGHEIMGYDPNLKKYVGSWVDSWTTSITPFESEWNAEKKQIRSVMTVKGPDGQPAKMLMVIDVVDDDHHDARMWTSADESGEPMMTIAYTRAAAPAAMDPKRRLEGKPRRGGPRAEPARPEKSTPNMQIKG
jgi:hypothetical protein